MIKLIHRKETLEQAEDIVREYVESLPSGSVFYDLGSCVGTYGILAYSRGLKTYCFEADKVNYDAALENYLANFEPNDNFKIFNIGIADKKGTIRLLIGQPDIGGHHKTLDIREYSGYPAARSELKTAMIDIDTLDNLIEINNLTQPDYMKVDIDGSEYIFLPGAKKALDHTKSLIIELYEEKEYFPKIIDTLENQHKFKLYKKGKELDPGLRDYWFVKQDLI